MTSGSLNSIAQVLEDGSVRTLEFLSLLLLDELKVDKPKCSRACALNHSGLSNEATV